MSQFEKKMNAAIDYFADNGHALEQIILRGKKKGLKESRVREGIVKVYDRIQAGESLKPIQIVWEAWEEAKRSQGKEYVEWCRDRNDYVVEISSLKRENFNLKMLALLCVLFVLSQWAFEWLNYVR